MTLAVAVRQMQSKGGNFVLSQIDPLALHLPAVSKRVSVADGALKIKNTANDKTEFKIKLERGCLQAKSGDQVPNMIVINFFVTRSNPAPKTVTFLAEDVRSRDVVVLVLKALVV
eukprot:CAMPEP_0173109674 /NCGR_PEP_ID=MMETSP1102-20130122/43675_1 /TAXON_ID=49646 /ORGANISM="Geminigera sp., Strain Caron Lab Isolate" /LENGTH=114 /DNA_ID=CAMNT_0014008823 /DNA_START=103 /DNA_END=446 /DNA_ORIENTATION=+